MFTEQSWRGAKKALGAFFCLSSEPKGPQEKTSWPGQAAFSEVSSSLVFFSLPGKVRPDGLKGAIFNSTSLCAKSRFEFGLKGTLEFYGLGAEPFLFSGPGPSGSWVPAGPQEGWPGLGRFFWLIGGKWGNRPEQSDSWGSLSHV
jgi:hypothetical protein